MNPKEETESSLEKESTTSRLAMLLSVVGGGLPYAIAVDWNIFFEWAKTSLHVHYYYYRLWLSSWTTRRAPPPPLPPHQQQHCYYDDGFIVKFDYSYETTAEKLASNCYNTSCPIGGFRRILLEAAGEGKVKVAQEKVSSSNLLLFGSRRGVFLQRKANYSRYNNGLIWNGLVAQDALRYSFLQWQ